MPKRLHALLDWLQDHEEVAKHIATIGRAAEIPMWLGMRLTAGGRASEVTPLLARYMDDDVLTPPYQSAEMARRMPNAEYIRLWRSSHFSMRERPEVVIPAMRRFLEARAAF